MSKFTEALFCVFMITFIYQYVSSLVAAHYAQKKYQEAMNRIMESSKRLDDE